MTVDFNSIKKFLQSRKVDFNDSVDEFQSLYINCLACKNENKEEMPVTIKEDGSFSCMECGFNADFEVLRKMVDSNNKVLGIQSEEGIDVEQVPNFKQRYLKTKEKDTKGRKEITYDMAKYLIKTFNIKTISTARHCEYYCWQDGVYVDGYNIIRSKIKQMLEEYVNKYCMNDILESIKDMCVVKRDDFVVDKNFINLKNGVYDISQNILLPHKPDYLFQTKMEAKYIEGADCPLIKQFLIDTVGEDNMLIVQELFGYLLYRSHKIKKAFILVGEPNTGKTTFIKVISAFIGDGNLSTIDLQTISHERFGSSNLYNKHANVCDDLSSEDVCGTGKFKMLTGDGKVSGEKKFGDSFSFMSFAKLIFACNKIPSVREIDDRGYFERWIVIPFENEIDKNKKDISLTEKLISENEMSGLLNLALEGLKRLLKNQEFSYPKDWQEIKKEMTCSGNPVAQFAYEVLIPSKDDYVTKDIMRDVFSGYRMKNELPYRSDKSFGGSLPKFAPYISSAKVTLPNSSKQITVWRGVKIKEDFVDLIPPQEQTVETDRIPSEKELLEMQRTEAQQLNFTSTDSMDYS